MNNRIYDSYMLYSSNIVDFRYILLNSYEHKFREISYSWLLNWGSFGIKSHFWNIGCLTAIYYSLTTLQIFAVYLLLFISSYIVKFSFVKCYILEVIVKFILVWSISCKTATCYSHPICSAGYNLNSVVVKRTCIPN